jgi:peptide deformylase
MTYKLFYNNLYVMCSDPHNFAFLLCSFSMKELSLFYYGHPILRKKAEPVTEITDEIRELVKAMLKKAAESGYGIAAPQVGYSLAIFITSPPVQDKNGQWVQSPPRVFINPKLTLPSQETWEHPDGCLSIPGIYANTRRPLCITVTALDIEGKEFTERLSGWPACVAMHENDHLNGVLFIDRMSTQERNKIESKLREIKKKYNPDITG